MNRPFRGLEAYTWEDAARFFGRDAETRLLTANAIASEFTVVYGASGVGKSSLLGAGLVASCRNIGAEVFLQRDWYPGALSRLNAAATIVSPVTASIRGQQLTEPLRVIIFDQFEQYFLHHKDDDQLYAWLEQGRREEISTHFVIGIRDDSLSLLDRFTESVPDVLLNLIRVDPLSVEAAIEALTRSVQAFLHEHKSEDVDIRTELLSEVVERTSSGHSIQKSLGLGKFTGTEIAPAAQLPYAQLVLDKLWDLELTMRSYKLTQDSLKAHGGPEAVVRLHLNTVMNSFVASDQEAVHQILRFLVSPGGTKLTLTAQDVAAFADVVAADASRVMSRLASFDARILRELRGDISADLYYELFHDFLVPPVLAWRHQYEVLRQRGWIQNFRRRWLLPIISGALIVSTSLAFLAYTKSKLAESQYQLAQKEARDAAQARDVAIAAQDDANSARSRIAQAFEFRQKLYSTNRVDIQQLLEVIPMAKELRFQLKHTRHNWNCEGGEPAYQFSLQPEAPEALRESVAIVTYYFAHSTFLAPSTTATPLNDFRVEWNGCGAINKIYAILEYRDPMATTPFSYSVINMLDLVDDTDQYGDTIQEKQ
jgi:hypothetical protein